MPEGEKPAGLLPHLVALPPADVQMDNTDPHRPYLRFTQAIGNLGPGPLQVRGVAESGGATAGFQEVLDAAGGVAYRLPLTAMFWHAEHEHWHIGDVAEYQLRQGSPNGPTVGTRSKTSFCLRDDVPLADYEGQRAARTYVNCNAPLMGISPGWMDVYPYRLSGQAIAVADVADGVYYLETRLDPAAMFRQDNTIFGNHIAWTKVEIWTEAGRWARAMAPDEVVIRIAGQRQVFLVSPRLLRERVVCHVRLAERLGAVVEWDGARVLIRKGRKRLIITPGRRHAQVNGRSVDMFGTPAFMTDDRVLASARFLAEQLGATANWLPDGWTLQIQP